MGPHQFADDVVGGDPCALESIEQPVAAVEQLLDLCAGRIATTAQLGQHLLAVLTSLVDHVATLLLGHVDLGLGITGGILADAGRLEHGRLADPGGILGRLLDEPGRGLLGPLADLRAGIACRRQHSCSLFSEQRGDRLFVQPPGSRHATGLHRAQLVLQEPLTLLQSRQFGRHHSQEITDLALVEPASSDGERSRSNRRGRRWIRSGERNGHQPTTVRPIGP